MNKNKLKQFVNALDTLSDDVKDMGVAMMSTDKPLCGTPGCHAGLIYIVSEELPELQEIYERIFFSHWNLKYSHYEYTIWADALAEFLGFSEEKDLECWAKDNPKIWGNKYGYDMFSGRLAFTNDEDKILKHRDIINHWKQVLKNIEA